MFCIIGEDDSDVAFLKTIVKRLAKDDHYPVKGMGYGGCGELLNKGAKQVRLYDKLYDPKGYIISYDSDRCDPKSRLQELEEKIVDKCGLAAAFCALVPVEEIESWILADVNSVRKVILTWKPVKEILHPEKVKNPKEYLEKLSERFRKPLYSHATHNPRVAEHLNLEKIYEKCESFRPLYDLVCLDKPNIDRRRPIK